jgi:hypothetical protein
MRGINHVDSKTNDIIKKSILIKTDHADLFIIENFKKSGTMNFKDKYAYYSLLKIESNMLFFFAYSYFLFSNYSHTFLIDTSIENSINTLKP